MTIACPAEFAEATRKAEDADALVEALLDSDKTPEDQKKDLRGKRGRATRTILACFAYRAKSDAMSNKDPHFPDGTEVRYRDGRVRTVFQGDLDVPIRETIIFHDVAPHSFFFREIYRDPDTHDRVDVYDRCWYVFDKDKYKGRPTDELTEAELEALVNQGTGVTRTFFQDTMREALDRGDHVREARVLRQGLCGGIIYHEDCGRDGRRTGYGSWSTHT